MAGTARVFVLFTIMIVTGICGAAEAQQSDSSAAAGEPAAAELVASILGIVHQQAQQGGKLRSSYDYKCRLLIKGHAPVNASMQPGGTAAAAAAAPQSHPSAPQDLWVAVAQLNCSSGLDTNHATASSSSMSSGVGASPTNTHAGFGPTVVFNATHLTQHASSFQGVQLVDSSNSSRVLELCGWLGEPPVFPLLAFCGNYSVLFELLLVEGLALPVSTSVVSKGSESTWDAAVLLFGGSIEAAVLDGVMHNTVAGTPIEIGDHASLLLSNTSITANTGAAWGGAVCVSTHGTAIITNGSNNNNMLPFMP